MPITISSFGQTFVLMFEMNPETGVLFCFMAFTGSVFDMQKVF
jgi:hypothetical protein